jgi:DNA-binding FadR family transcriptional regulator
MPIQAIANHRIYRQIADQLGALIDTGEFPPGGRLPSERELAMLLGVSRPSVREALIALEMSGKVEVRVGAGVFVAAQSPAANAGKMEEEQSPHELLRPRWTLEGEIAMEAARKARPSDLEAIRAAVSRMQRSEPGGREADALDRDFHLGIARATHNGALYTIASALWDQSRGALWKRAEQHFESLRVMAATLRDHCAILAAIEARDGRRARAAMRVHLENVDHEFRRAWALVEAAEMRAEARPKVRRRPARG